MPCYWLDTSVFIQAYQGAYSFDIVPAFWDFLQQQIENGVLRSPEPVLKEIKDGDQLAAWVDKIKSILSVQPDQSVQSTYQSIADHVRGNYQPYHTNRFLTGADGWVIAQAQVDSGTIVCQENRRKEKRAKIPVISDEFGV